MLSRLKGVVRRHNAALKAVAEAVKQNHKATNELVRAINALSQSPQASLDPKLSRLINEFATSRRDWLAIGTPWITQAATNWLERNLRGTDRVLEYGTGRSTGWWATHTGHVTCVEASPDWTIWFLLYAYTRPEILKKVRFYFCPSEWNPDFETGRRDYWKRNLPSLTQQDVYDLERDLIRPEFPGHNILFFDGSIRNTVFAYKMRTLDLSGVDMIVVDNTEGASTSLLADALAPEGFTRLDFAAGPNDQVPAHQKGKHITSAFVRDERLRQCVPVITPHPIQMSEEERRKHMHESSLTIDEVREQVASILKYIEAKLGLATVQADLKGQNTGP